MDRRLLASSARFTRIVLRNSLPGILSTAIFTFLARLERLPRRHRLPPHRDTKFTLPLGVESFFQQNVTDWGSVMAVAVRHDGCRRCIVFAFLNRYFSVGGIGGSLAGH